MLSFSGVCSITYMMNATTTQGDNTMANEIIATRKVQIRGIAATYHMTSDTNVIRIKDGQTESVLVGEMSGFSKDDFMASEAYPYFFNAEARFARKDLGLPRYATLPRRF